MGYSARILADHLAPSGYRLTTFEVTFPRIVLSEFNTHRQLCLAGDAMLEFDLPAGTSKGQHKRVYCMRLDEFVDKWLNGARRTKANPKKNYPADFVPDQIYTPKQAATMMGMANQFNINLLCRSGALPAQKRGRVWHILGKDLIAWRNHIPEHTRFDMKNKLAEMHIRQLNEDTGDIQTSHVKAVYESGEKEVYEVRASEFRVAGSKDHRVLTTDGWKPIGELRPGSQILVRKFGKRDSDKKDPLSLTKINGVWRSMWQRKQRKKMQEVDPLCRICRVTNGTDIHHLVPVYQDVSRALDESNITLVCDKCHDDMHRKQGWQGDTYLYGAAVTVDEVVFRGVEKTYDLEIAGDYPNFLANGVVVHNSRNSASSRAIPIEKMMSRVELDPFVPTYWGANQKGMQAEAALPLEVQDAARYQWHAARLDAMNRAKHLKSLGVHKQLVNRLLEPFMWQTVICTATEWENFFALRNHKDAQPEIKEIASRMEAVYRANRPKFVEAGFWHMPLMDDADELRAGGYSEEQVRQVSVGRCARVSYLTHDGERNPWADIELCERLRASGHMSPFEHVAMASAADVPSGNFRGWVQLRKLVPNEAIYQREGT